MSKDKFYIEYSKALFKVGKYVGVICIMAFITVILFSSVAATSEDNNVYYEKIKTIEPKNAGNQYCYVKVVIKQKGDNIVKEEILECADGRKTVDGPSYWEMFAQFYYRDVATPEYCRSYSRPDHIFKSFGKVCLNKDGEWRVQND